MARTYTCLQAAYQVLEINGKPMTSKEISDEIMKNHVDVLTTLTPDRSVNARISENIKKNREKSAFKRVGKGLYGLRTFKQNEIKTIGFRRRIFPGDQILVFDTKLLNKISNFRGIRKDFEIYADSIFSWNNYRFIERIAAERSEKNKQVISYTIITYQDQILQFTRGEISNVRKYLFGYSSIGFGGHVQLTDFDLFNDGLNGYLKSARREVKEETGIIIDEEKEPRIVGVLNDNSSSLGRHHFAFIHMYEAKSPEFFKKEKSINQLKFVKISDLGLDFGKYEYWSRLCILNYFSDLTSPRCFIVSKKNSKPLFTHQVIQVVGQIGSGKTEACSLLEKEFNYKAIKASIILRRILGLSTEENIPREMLQDAGYKFIKSKLGHEKLATEIIKVIRSNPKQCWVIDGLRFPKTCEVLQKLYGQKIPIIYIDTLIDNQYKYYLDREHTEKSFDEFLEIIDHPAEREIERLWHKADFIVYNHSSLNAYIEQLKEFLLEESKK